MNAIWQKISALLLANQRIFCLGFNKVSLVTTFNLPERFMSAEAPSSWLLWVDIARWRIASSGKNGNHPFETAEIRLASTILQGVLALPHHPEMPYVAVAGITQKVTQLAGAFRYARQSIHPILAPLVKGLFVFQRSLPFQSWLTEQSNQLCLLSHLLERANAQLNWQQKLKKLGLNGAFAPMQWVYSVIQQRLIQASIQPETNEGWQGQGLCFGLIDFLNSPLTAKEPHPPTIIYFITEFDTQLLLDEELRLVIAEILPQVLQPTDVLLMPSFWHQSQFLASFPSVNPQQVRVLYPCVDSRFKLTKEKRKTLKNLSHNTAFRETVGLPPDAPFFLVVLDKDRSFRWFHTVLAGFECFHDICDAEAKNTAEPTLAEGIQPCLPPAMPVQLVFVGLGLADFPAYQKLLEEALPANLQGRVYLHGNVPVALLLKLYATAKGLFYLPAERELGLGLSVLEALVVQCPVVISKVGHLEEWSEKASLLLEPHEPLQVAFAMAQLMDEAELADALRHNGRKRSLLSGVEGFTQALIGHFGGASLASVQVTSAKKESSTLNP